MDIYSILNVNQDIIQNIAFQANRVDDKETERAINRNIKLLCDIGRKHDSDVDVNIPANSIDDTVQKILKVAKSGSEIDLTLSELRIISYNLAQFHGDDNAYKFAISTLESNWHDLFFNGIASYLLSSWTHIRVDYLNLATQLFASKLNNYKGSINKYLKYKENIDFFQDGGPLRLGALMAIRNINLRDAPSVLGYKQSAFAHSYFSDVIIKYVKDKGIADVDYLEDDIFAFHKEDRTKKIVFSRLVLSAEKNGDAVRQKRVSAVARRVLGDISLASTWAPFQGATDEDISNLKRASELVNLWINRKAIEAFFEVCVQDKAREKFWLNYAKDVTTFKIAGSSLILQSLRQDPRIDFQTLMKCFIETRSGLSQTSALILVFKGKAIVEFSDVGSVYAYNVSNSIISPHLRGRANLERTEDLKLTSLPLLVENEGYYSYMQDEGRMTHRGDWQSRLRQWLERKVFVSSNVAPSLFSFDSNIFKKSPIEYSTPKIKSNFADTKNNKSIVSNKGQSKVKHPSLFDRDETDGNAKKINSNISSSTVSHPLNQINSRSIWSGLSNTVIIRSKWIFDGLCQVVGTKDGFYLHLDYGNRSRYAKIKSYSISRAEFGSVWIRRPISNDLHPIIYYYSNKEINIGYIKVSGDNILYKESENSSSYLILPIK